VTLVNVLPTSSKNSAEGLFITYLHSCIRVLYDVLVYLEQGIGIGMPQPRADKAFTRFNVHVIAGRMNKS